MASFQHGSDAVRESDHTGAGEAAATSAADDAAIGRAYKAGYEAGYEAGRSTQAPRYSNLPSVILSRLPIGEWRTEDARKQVAATGVQATPKQVFNALGYLTRRGRVRRLGYGRYQTVRPAISGGHDAG